MRKYFDWVKAALFSATIKDTFVLFVGNVTSAFWGFLFTLFAARAFTVSDFGIFSATLNLAVILTSLADIGISSGSVNFVSEFLAKGDHKKSDEYIKASFVIRLIIVLAISGIVALFAPFVSRSFLATRNPAMALWAAAIPIFLFPDAFFPSILQAKKKFLHSTLIDNVFYIGRLLFALAFYVYGALTISVAFWAYGLGFIIETILVVYFVKTDFLLASPGKEEYKNLLKFSGWIGVNRIISSISGRLDVQMLAMMAGAVATGLYSIPSRLASFIVVLAGSYSAVLAPRLAAFGDKEKEKTYIIKSTIALVPIAVGIVFLIIIAKPFILILFGSKYLDSVPVFQALAAANIPFIFTAPATTAIIYSMKRPIYFGVFSFFQLAAIAVLNFMLIPKFGPFGPTITFGIFYMILLIYVWTVTIKHYWGKNE